jgi:hypothetical protein
MTEATPTPVPVGPPAAKWNVLAIVSLVTSILLISLAGIITGHIALSQIKKTGEQGNVLAIIGLILGYLGLVVTVVGGILWIVFFAALGATGSFTTY